MLQPELNISAFTAAGPRNKSRGWDTSLGGRSHGSLYATAVRVKMVRNEPTNAMTISPSYQVCQLASTQSVSNSLAIHSYCLLKMVHVSQLERFRLYIGNKSLVTSSNCGRTQGTTGAPRELISPWTSIPEDTSQATEGMQSQ